MGMKTFVIVMIMDYNASSTRNMCFRWERCGHCGECVDMCSDEELGDAVDGVVGDAECYDGDKCDTDHGNISGGL